MSFEAAEAIAQTVLYEGYVLYPYRASSVKNRHRWMFGTLAPKGGVEASTMRTECLFRGEGDTRLDVSVRFLHTFDACLPGADSPSREATPRNVTLMGVPLHDLAGDGRVAPFHFTPTESGMMPLRGAVVVRAESVAAGVYKLTVDVTNDTAPETGVDGALLSLMSTHTLLGIEGGESAELCSLADPPDDLRAASAACRNTGTWPALIAKKTILSSPIILPDHPEVAPESPHDLFDGTEIDEILTLRILTLSEAEKLEIRRAGGRAAELLDRTLRLGEHDLARLHGALRRGKQSSLAPGDRVRLQPRGRADVLDIALSGRLATISSLEEDFEGRAYVAVTIDDDPGRDLGETGQPGHRFFFSAEEVERVR